jgi:hypothetical protein
MPNQSPPPSTGTGAPYAGAGPPWNRVVMGSMHTGPRGPLLELPQARRVLRRARARRRGAHRHRRHRAEPRAAGSLPGAGTMNRPRRTAPPRRVTRAVHEPAARSRCRSCTRVATRTTRSRCRRRRQVADHARSRRGPDGAQIRSDDRRLRTLGRARARGRLRRRRGHGQRGLPAQPVPLRAHQPPHRRWGGDIEARMRCRSRSCARCAKAVGGDFLVIYRLSLLDLVEGGNTWPEIVVAAEGARGRRGAPAQHRHRLARGARPHDRDLGAARRVPWRDRAPQARALDPGVRVEPHQHPEVAEEILASRRRRHGLAWRARCSPTRSS